MRVLLVGPDFEDNLSVRYLSAALHDAGFVAELAAFNDASDTERVVEAARGFDMVGLSICFQVRAIEFLELAERLRRDSDPMIVAGGHYATCAAEELLAHHPAIDVIVMHEGERTIVELARTGRDLARLREVPGVVVNDGDGGSITTAPRRSETDLDVLPPPDRRGKVHLFSGVPTAWLLGSRGCVATCDYCCIVTLHEKAPGRKFRQRDPALVVEEMAQLYRRRGIRQFIFHDDNFLVPRVSKNHERLEAYERALRAEGLTDIGITIKCRPPDAERSVFERLERMGLLRVYLGIESSSEEGLCSIGRVQTVEQSAHALDLCRELEISAQFTMMMFHPDATAATIRSDLAFMRAHAFHALNFCRTEIYAGTPLEAKMRAEGRAFGDYLGRTYRIADPIIERTCQLAVGLFGPRCWAMGGLMERLIGMDHLAAVLRHFYTAPDEAGEARAIFDAIRAHREATNVELVELLEALVVAVSDHAHSPAVLSDRVRAIAARERATRATAFAELERLRARMDEFALRRTGLRRDRRDDKALSLRPSRLRQNLATHAAAVAIAFAVATGCEEELPVEPAPPPPVPAPEAVGPPMEPLLPRADPAPEPEPRAEVRVGTEPEGAEIVLDGVVLGNAPMLIPLPDAPTTYVVRMDGYAERSIVIGPDTARSLTIRLERRRRRLPVAPSPNARPPRQPVPPPSRPPSLHDGISEMSPWGLRGPGPDDEVEAILRRVERDAEREASS